ncbi:hypothetical protein IMZ31_22215 (plasmid) [Pontibacillus sp. ALD_SL1]|uniref:hypothetical protein n=1 Tax=Pontibacillus sp. ALD_SL1 TaxID=2777185 RepID=UPI001A96D74F|nr:hypothetical protein [Pontibacillus sp. ALD_SL1]QST02170.1 hypothetical protein IMZ31_22215 [Pontibacillus sp. ALD_SL1]
MNTKEVVMDREHIWRRVADCFVLPARRLRDESSDAEKGRKFIKFMSQSQFNWVEKNKIGMDEDSIGREWVFDVDGEEVSIIEMKEGRFSSIHTTFGSIDEYDETAEGEVAIVEFIWSLLLLLETEWNELKAFKE